MISISTFAIAKLFSLLLCYTFLSIILTRILYDNVMLFQLLSEMLMVIISNLCTVTYTLLLLTLPYSSIYIPAECVLAYFFGFRFRLSSSTDSKSFECVERPHSNELPALRSKIQKKNITFERKTSRKNWIGKIFGFISQHTTDINLKLRDIG